ncbi:hypothetical protein U1Q18_037627 [Sarracenia purpurea var. burkii]
MSIPHAPPSIPLSSLSPNSLLPSLTPSSIPMSSNPPSPIQFTHSSAANPLVNSAASTNSSYFGNPSAISPIPNSNGLTSSPYFLYNSSPSLSHSSTPIPLTIQILPKPLVTNIRPMLTRFKTSTLPTYFSTAINNPASLLLKLYLAVS